LKSEIPNELPYPSDAQNFGVTTTQDLKQITFETKKSPAEVQKFYKNVLSESEWVTESEGIANSFLIAKFKKEDKLVTIVSSEQENPKTTFASIKISLR